MNYAIIDVGCIECVEETTFLGVYATREQAEEAFDEMDFQGRPTIFEVGIPLHYDCGEWGERRETHHPDL